MNIVKDIDPFNFEKVILFLKSIPPEGNGVTHRMTFKAVKMLKENCGLSDDAVHRIMDKYSPRSDSKEKEREIKNALISYHCGPSGGLPGVPEVTQEEIDDYVKHHLNGFEIGIKQVRDASPVKVPTNSHVLHFDTYLKEVATQTGLVNIHVDYKKIKERFEPFGHGHCKTVREWLSNPMLSTSKELKGRIWHAKLKLASGGGVWTRINAMDGKGVSNENVTDFRYTLLEGDTLPIKTQLAISCTLPWPVRAIIYSAGKSLHTLIQIDAKNFDDYIDKAGEIWKTAIKLGFDPQARNPSRLTRLPGAKRLSYTGERLSDKQQLFYVNNDPQPQPIKNLL